MFVEILLEAQFASSNFRDIVHDLGASGRLPELPEEVGYLLHYCVAFKFEDVSRRLYNKKLNGS